MKEYFKKINKYSSQDILEWKNTNICTLYVKIYNNIPTFELLYIKECDRAESIKKIILDTLKKHTINNVEIFINLMDFNKAKSILQLDEVTPEKIKQQITFNEWARQLRVSSLWDSHKLENKEFIKRLEEARFAFTQNINNG
jgi:hypothetical protein